jgi:hypothetical protein
MAKMLTLAKLSYGVWKIGKFCILYNFIIIPSMEYNSHHVGNILHLFPKIGN